MNSEDVLLRRLQSKEQAAWSELYQMYTQPLYNFIRRNNIYDASDVEDILQDTWMAAPRAIDNFDGKNATLKTFLFSLARRKIADYWRKHKAVDELPETMSVSESHQQRLELVEALALMPEQERQALILRYSEGFSVTEIADIMGRTYKGTESLLSRARVRLDKYLNSDSDFR
ncbi:MAG: RNA polymerase sigma factor [Caldilineaceae bacterium]|nr:RNA polymerase sigma factor [Caldilineaceae bacterium]MCB9149787.1 RNA polymerase sigma factor [Caldilineaceae bacterium]